MKFSKYIFLSVAILLMATDIAFGQSYSITPNDTFEIAGMREDLQTLSISQLNTSSDTIVLKWKKVSAYVPAVWDATICDNQLCNTSLVDSGMMNPVIPGETGFLVLHITAHVNYGTSIVRYAVWDTASPLLKDTLTFILKVENTTGISATDNHQFNIFPNPVNDQLNIVTDRPTGFQYMIFDESGKMIRSGKSDRKDLTLSTTNIPDGVFSISILSNGELMAVKKLIVSH